MTDHQSPALTLHERPAKRNPSQPAALVAHCGAVVFGAAKEDSINENHNGDRRDDLEDPREKTR